MVQKLFEPRCTLVMGMGSYKTGNMIKHIYLQLIGEQERVIWKALRFANDARPKAQFTLWLQLHGRLLTADRLLSWGMSIDKKCSLCQLQDETRNHLFMECSYVKQVWDGLLKWMCRAAPVQTNWDQHISWIIRQSKGKSRKAHVFKLVYTEFVHAIWIERNGRIFEKKQKEYKQLIKEVTYISCVRATTRTKSLFQSFLL
ncbi:uncharacterized protein LOC132615218 [Lycium barbarum]|uniref:uncharacterized protein LOC132615218 n=1 Tax=Lycium barbarum TaxID=112863 RepID=UPI00293E39AB|nr:uncharacterized protein LOC132615218 [Lycium barbarum]